MGSSLPKQLAEAGADGDTQSLKLLLNEERAKYEINSPVDESGVTAIHVACEHGRTAIVRQLLDHSASLNVYKNDGFSPLHSAALHGHAGTLDLLLNSNADLMVDEATKDGSTPLFLSVLKDSVMAFQTLLSANADVNKSRNDKSSPLHIACRNGRGTIIKLLTKHRADINCRRSSGATPLFLAVEFRHMDLANYLIRCGADTNTSRNDGCTALFIATQQGNIQMMETLLSQGAEINAENKKGATALHVAIQNNSYDVTKFLLENNSDVNCGSDGLKPPLLIACHRKYKDLIKLLIDNGADTDPIFSLNESQNTIIDNDILDILKLLDGTPSLSSTPTTKSQTPTHSHPTGPRLTFSAQPLGSSSVHNHDEDADDDTKPPLNKPVHKSIYSQFVTSVLTPKGGSDEPKLGQFSEEKGNTSEIAQTERRDRPYNVIAPSQFLQDKVIDARKPRIFDEFTAHVGHDELDPIKTEMILTQDLKDVYQLAEGEFGMVFRANWTFAGSNYDCCVKAPKQKSEQKLTEIELLFRLPRHPNICAILGLCENFHHSLLKESCIGIVMSYQKHRDLRKLLSMYGEFSSSEYLRLILGIARGVNHLHKNNVIHRDIHLGNILISGEGRAVIADFGLSCQLGRTSFVKHNREKFAWRCCAPESLQSGEFSKKSDVWMFGIAICEMLMGKLPFKDFTTVRDLARSNAVVLLSEECSAPAIVREIQRRCCSRDPNKRPQMKDVADLMEADHLNQKDVVMQSWLFKRGQWNKAWKQRYFVLRTSKIGNFSLVYSRSPAEIQLNEELGSIDIRTSTRIFQNSSSKFEYAISIDTPERIWELAANSAHLRDGWLRHLQLARKISLGEHPVVLDEQLQEMKFPSIPYLSAQESTASIPVPNPSTLKENQIPVESLGEAANPTSIAPTTGTSTTAPTCEIANDSMSVSDERSSVTRKENMMLVGVYDFKNRKKRPIAVKVAESWPIDMVVSEACKLLGKEDGKCICTAEMLEITHTENLFVGHVYALASAEEVDGYWEKKFSAK